MNATEAVRPNSEESKKERTKQVKLVLYQGRKVEHIFPRSDSPRLSMLDKFWMSLNYTFEMELFQQRSSLYAPKNFKEIVGRIDQLSLVENAEDSKRYQQVLQRLQELFISLCKGKQIALRLVGASSMQELYEKQVRLKLFRQSAEQQYLKNLFYVSNRKEIDQYLILAFKQNLNEQDQKIIKEYWDLLSAWPKTYIEKANQFTLYFDTLFLDLISAYLDMTQMKQYSTGDEFCHHFKELILEKLKHSLTQAKMVYSAEYDGAVLDYVFLMGECKLEEVLRQKVRQELRSKWQEMKDSVEQRTNFFREENQKKIASYIAQKLTRYQSYQTLLGELAEEIQKRRDKSPDLSPIASARLYELCQITLQAQELILEVRENQREENLDDLNLSLNKVLKELSADGILSEQLESVLIRNLKNIFHLHKRIESCLKKTDQDFMELALKSVKKCFGETPDEIWAYIPQQTAFENLMFDIRRIGNSNPFSNQEHPFNIVICSLEIPWNMAQISKNPVKYFFKQLEKIDEEKLDLLSSRIVVME